MANEKEPPIVPRRTRRDFPALRQTAFTADRLDLLRPPDDPDCDKFQETPDADPHLHENLLRQYRDKA